MGNKEERRKKDNKSQLVRIKRGTKNSRRRAEEEGRSEFL